MNSVSVAAARSILGDDVLTPDDAAAAFGSTEAAGADSLIPFSQTDLEVARNAGEMLVFRIANLGGQDLTIQRMIELHPNAFDQRFLRKVGYQLKDEWGIELEPGAAIDTSEPGWALVRRAPLEGSYNITYEEQEQSLRHYADRFGLNQKALRRRHGVEIVYDALLYFVSRKARLLDKAWDWSDTRTVDGGYLNVGGFAKQGLQVFSYSRAVRHGALGVCPTRYATR